MKNYIYHLYLLMFYFIYLGSPATSPSLDPISDFRSGKLILIFRFYSGLI